MLNLKIYIIQAEEKKPEEKPKKKVVKKDEPGAKKRPSLKEKEVHALYTKHST